MTEARLTMIKRLRMRSWRRGIKEMDLILGGFADNGLERLSDAELVVYDDMLEENDYDLYQWASGQEQPPERFRTLLERAVSEKRTK